MCVCVCAKGGVWVGGAPERGGCPRGGRLWRPRRGGGAHVKREKRRRRERAERGKGRGQGQAIKAAPVLSAGRRPGPAGRMMPATAGQRGRAIKALARRCRPAASRGARWTEEGPDTPAGGPRHGQKQQRAGPTPLILALIPGAWVGRYYFFYPLFLHLSQGSRRLSLPCLRPPTLPPG